LNPYRCFIGVDPEGLSQAAVFAAFVKAPIAYYSLELLLSHELDTRMEARLKKRELSLSRRAAFIVIQDEERAGLLAGDNQIPLEKFVFVPNAPLGPARCSRSKYWHERFGLSPDFRVVLHAGSLEKWTGVREIVESVNSWPDHWVLVLHSRYRADSSNDVEELRKFAASGRVFFSLKPASRQEYDRLLDGADIGIAFYVPEPGSAFTQLNLQTVGLSSGKVAYYLRAGLPVIVNETTSIADVVRGERCGVSIQKGADVGNAIAKIAEDYDGYSENAHRTFNSYFDFKRGFQHAMNRIDSLAKDGRRHE
jgi:glycosyltransferase involved in cell wall biosynthesis